MRARGTVEMEDLLVFISISLWEGANPSYGCEMRVMGGGGLEVTPTEGCTIGRCILLWCP